MLYAPLDTLNKPDRRVASPSTTVHQEASKAIVQAVCSGRSMVGVVAAAGNTTSAVIAAALNDLASRKTRVICMRRTTVSCLGPASAMDHLRVSELQTNGGNSDRSKQIVQGLQLLGQPVPGEVRRLLVIEDAEEVDPALLENLARIPGLGAPTLPLQLLYVGCPAYWDSLIALNDGAARRLIGSPMVLLEAPSETGSIAPSPVTGAKVDAVVVPLAAPETIHRPKWLSAGLGCLGFGAVLGIGMADQGRLTSFIEAYHPPARDGAESPSRMAGTTGPSSSSLEGEPNRPASPGRTAPETGLKTAVTKPEVAEAAAVPDAAPPRTITADKSAFLDAKRVPSPQMTSSQLEPAPATQAPAAVARTIGTSMSRGDAMLGLHDLSAARRYYELAAKAGSADAALALGRTYDPTSMVRSGAVSLQPDATLAAEWYRKAADLGSSEAGTALRNLGRQQSN